MDKASIYGVEAGSGCVRQYSYRTKPYETLEAGYPWNPSSMHSVAEYSEIYIYGYVVLEGTGPRKGP